MLAAMRLDVSCHKRIYIHPSNSVKQQRAWSHRAICELDLGGLVQNSNDAEQCKNLFKTYCDSYGICFETGGNRDLHDSRAYLMHMSNAHNWTERRIIVQQRPVGTICSAGAFSRSGMGLVNNLDSRM